MMKGPKQELTRAVVLTLKCSLEGTTPPTID